MFTLELRLVPFHVSGLNSIDLARRLGLPDSTGLSNAGPNQSGRYTPECNVGEAFARAWFTPMQTEGCADVPIDMLAAGDVRMATDGNSYSVTFANLSPERIQELYIAVRFRACREQVERLEARIAELTEEN